MPRPERQLIEAIVCAGGPAGLLRISGTIAITGEQRLSDHCNRSDGELELTNSRAEMVIGGKVYRRAAAETIQVNLDEIDLIWSTERRRGGDPAMRVELDSKSVRAMTSGADVVGVTRLPQETIGFGHLLLGRDRFITISPARIESPHLPAANAGALVEVCLVNRSHVVALALDASDTAAERARRCFRTRCENPAVTSCAYTDATGAACGTSWCEEHSRALGEHRYCERHHEVMVALNAAAGSIREFRPPLVNDRTLSLIQMLFKAMDPEVTARLEAERAAVEGAVVSVDQHVRHQILDGQVCWERGWGVAVPQGYVIRVLLRVPLGEPPVVRLLVNRREVFGGVPEWIAARRAGQTPAEADKQAFTARLVELVRAAL